MVQTSYSNAPALGVSGAEAYAGSAEGKRTYTVEGTDGVVMGRLVCRGTADKQCANPAAAGDIDAGTVLGFVLGYVSAEDTTIAEGRQATVVRRGTLLITCETAFAAGETLHVRYDGDPDMGEFVGAIRNATVSMETVEIDGDNGRAVFMNSGDAGDLAEVEFDFTGF